MSDMSVSSNASRDMDVRRIILQAVGLQNQLMELRMGIDSFQAEKNSPVQKVDESFLCKLSRPLNNTATLSHLRSREYGLSNKRNLCSARREFLSKKLPDYVSQHLPGILSEKEYNLGTINKVFASKWLNNSQVVIGSKCNKLLVMDTKSGRVDHIPSLKSSAESTPANCPCGIHSIAVNPSATMLATGAQNTNDLAIYELPTFDPLAVGEQAHKDWIFDMDWVDDEHVVTGSRDSSVAIWRVNSDDYPCYQVGSSGDSDSLFPSHKTIKPCVTKNCVGAMRVRALALSKAKRKMGVLSMNAKFHLWDLETFSQLHSVNLPWRRENVCMARSDELGVFAVGSQSYITLIDQRHKGYSRCFPLQVPVSQGENGIRSLSFNNNIVTIGGGSGRVIFFDMRAAEFLQREGGKNCELRVGSGWLKHDTNYREHFVHGNYPNAIYTHCYDDSNTRLFVAGGPLPAGLYGNYAGLFY